MKFICKQCGHCCLNLRDVRQWQEHDREDVLAWVGPVSAGDEVLAYDIWISPATGDDVARCPWLRKLPGKNRYICRIHEMKPSHCREYPHSREHAEKTGCPGFANSTYGGNAKNTGMNQS